MHIALVVPPFISVPPQTYGGTELFVAHLARGLHARGHRVTVYANGESKVCGELKWRYRRSEWPITDLSAAQLKNMNHTAWAIRDAARSVDLIHLNDLIGLPFTKLVDAPVALTLHHPHDPVLSQQYLRYPQTQYIAISQYQARREPMPNTTVVYHGLRLSDYTFRANKCDYLVFLGRMAPCKGAHVAIEVARHAGLRLKLAGEIQPIFNEYWEQEVAPHIDGDRIQYVGEADAARKNELLSNARALLFPIQWEEPFGLVMVEAMACGTPVLAFSGGSVSEIVRDGVSGWVCRDIDDMAGRARVPAVAPESCRAWVADRFSYERMTDRHLKLYERMIERHRLESLRSVS